MDLMRQGAESRAIVQFAEYAGSYMNPDAYPRSAVIAVGSTMKKHKAANKKDIKLAWRSINAAAAFEIQDVRLAASVLDSGTSRSRSIRPLFHISMRIRWSTSHKVVVSTLAARATFSLDCYSQKTHAISISRNKYIR
jgi:hypothetical protein